MPGHRLPPLLFMTDMALRARGRKTRNLRSCFLSGGAIFGASEEWGASKNMRSSARFQHSISSHGEAERRAEKDVRREMRAGSHTRKADGGGEAVGQPRDPAMIVIATGHHRCNGKSAGSVSGRERAPFKGRFAAIE